MKSIKAGIRSYARYPLAVLVVIVLLITVFPIMIYGQDPEPPGRTPPPARGGESAPSWSDSVSVEVSAGDVPHVGLISDQAELSAITPILDEMDLTYDVLNNNWNGSQGVYTSDYTVLENYDVVIWYGSGATWGRPTTPEEYSALELYLQTGGRLLVTGYDTIGSPTDPLLADLIRSSSSGDGPFTYDYTITDGSHPIADGPYGTFPTGTALTAGDYDHDQAEADTGRNAVTVAELTGGRDKIIATDLDPANLDSGRVVYWNGNYNAWDWVGYPGITLADEIGLELKPETQERLSLSKEALLSQAQSVDAADLPPEANYDGIGPAWRLDDEALAGVRSILAELALLAEDYTFFIATGDTVVVVYYPAWWHAGDYAEGVRTLSLNTVEHVEYDLVISENYLSSTGHVDFDLSINGIVVGSFTVLPGEFLKHVAFDFPAIAGPTYTIRLEETNTVDLGCGSIVLPPDQSIMLLSSRQPELLKNIIVWLSEGRGPTLFCEEFESGTEGWATTGFWHLVQDGVSPYPNSHSPTHSWWYGQDATGDYDNGAQNSGDLTSPLIDLPNQGPRIYFWNWYETEYFTVPQSVYFDIYHDTDGDSISGGTYTHWGADLMGAGWVVDEYNQTIDLATLVAYDVLALFDPEVALTASEITAINNFLLGGGRVVVLGEWGNLDGTNTILNALTTAHGITLNSDTLYDPTNNDGQDYWPLIYNFADDPLVKGVGTVVLYAGASLSLSGSAVPLATGDSDTYVTSAALAAADGGGDEDGNSLDLPSQPRDIVLDGPPVVMAAAPVGAGLVIAIGDSGLWSNTDPDMDGIISLEEYNNTLLSRRLFGKVVDDPWWDQKWVQISVDGGPFQDLVQVTGGPMSEWLRYRIDLPGYEGATVQIRFHFDTFDAGFNNYRGWYIDDFCVGPPRRTFLPLVLKSYGP